MRKNNGKSPARQGLRVLDISKPEKQTVVLDLDGLAVHPSCVQEGNIEILKEDLEFLLKCVQDLANSLDTDAEEEFFECVTGAGKYDREGIQIMGNLINRANDLRDYARTMAEGFDLERDDDGKR